MFPLGERNMFRCTIAVGAGVGGGTLARVDEVVVSGVVPAPIVACGAAPVAVALIVPVAVGVLAPGVTVTVFVVPPPPQAANSTVRATVMVAVH